MNSFSDTIQSFQYVGNTPSITTLTARLSVARTRISTATVNGVALFVGGYGGALATTASRTVDYYDGVEWSSLLMPSGVSVTHAAVGVVGHTAVFFGGSGGGISSPTDAIVTYVDEPVVPTPSPTPLTTTTITTTSTSTATSSTTTSNTLLSSTSAAPTTAPTSAPTPVVPPYHHFIFFAFLKWSFLAYSGANTSSYTTTRCQM